MGQKINLGMKNVKLRMKKKSEPRARLGGNRSPPGGDANGQIHAQKTSW